ncbi:MAG: DUF4143 domain-containing protein [Bifidobacteriaceae bacterium]|jgi:predicted AAA+ superfamily ATPase|nr:DUF4143 domain-containing protein [Bifidobacteriaceae bacterium]
MAAARPRYRTRVVDAQVTAALRRAGALVIEGPKACGKTWTALHHTASNARLDTSTQLRRAGLADPFVLLAGPTPRLIDEWQLVPDVWNAVRAEVDNRQADGQFILTGSSRPHEDQTRHSGAMRLTHLTMRPMTSLETGDSDGSVSLAATWRSEPVRAATPDVSPTAQTKAIAQAVCRGGWPPNLKRTTEDAMAANADYLRAIAGTDVQMLDGVKHDPRKMEALLFALARGSASYVTAKTLQADIVRFGQTAQPKTLQNYLDALARLWIYMEQPAWGGHLRSAAPARKAPKRHLVDPSLAAAALGADPDSLMTDREAFGQLFESLVFRDLTVYGQPEGLDVRAFQDAVGNEMDAVLVHGTQWAGIEVRLSPIPDVLDQAAAQLLRIAGRFTVDPRFLAIITGGGASYTRPDGVHVISALSLAP